MLLTTWIDTVLDRVLFYQGYNYFKPAFCRITEAVSEYLVHGGENQI